MVWEISKDLDRKYDVLSHIMCDLVNTENDTDKSPNIIEDYDTAKNLFTEEYIFIKGVVIANIVSNLLPETRGYIQDQMIQAKE